MARRKYIINCEFTAWEPGKPENRTLMKRDYEVFCDLDDPGETVTFMHSIIWFEVGRKTFVNCTSLAPPSAGWQPGR